MESRHCPRCELTLPLSAFGRSSSRAAQGYCRACMATYRSARQFPRSHEPKRCPGCGTNKPAEAFASGARMTDGLQTRCRACQRAARNVPGVARRKRAARYGLTLAGYDELLVAQCGLCALCDVPLKPRHAIDHEHSTGHVRGLLCMACNTALGAFGDSSERLLRAAHYLGGAA